MPVHSVAADAALNCGDTLHPDFMPTELQRTHLQSAMAADAASRDQLDALVEHTKTELRRAQATYHAKLCSLREDQQALEKGMRQAAAIVAAIRKLPTELLTTCFELVQDPWPVAGVCVRWRRAALSTQSLWCNINVCVFGSSKSVDTIRLWLQRSGHTLPLNIDIELVRRSRSCKLANGVDVPKPPTVLRREYQGNQAAEHPAWLPTNLFYLSEHMHRWKRFVFKFDCSLPAISGLQGLTGPTPLLEHFEVYRKAPPGPANDYVPSGWTYLLSGGVANTSRLKHVTLHYIPMSFNAQFFTGGALESLSVTRLCEAGTADTVHQVLQRHALTLRKLHLDLPNLSQALVPMTKLTLPALEILEIAGTSSVIPVLESLTTPVLHSLAFDFDGSSTTTPADAFHALVIRSNLPALRSLSLGTITPSGTYRTSGYGGGLHFGDAGLLAKLTSVRDLSLDSELEDTPRVLQALGGEHGAPSLPQLERLELFVSANDPHHMQAALVDMLKAREDGGARLPALRLVMRQALLPERAEWLRARVPRLDVVLEGPALHAPAAHPLMPVPPVLPPGSVLPPPGYIYGGAPTYYDVHSVDQYGMVHPPGAPMPSHHVLAYDEDSDGSVGHGGYTDDY